MNPDAANGKGSDGMVSVKMPVVAVVLDQDRSETGLRRALHSEVITRSRAIGDTARADTGAAGRAADPYRKQAARLTGRIALVRSDPGCVTEMAMIPTVATKWGDARIWAAAVVDRSRYRRVPEP